MMVVREWSGHQLHWSPMSDYTHYRQWEYFARTGLSSKIKCNTNFSFWYLMITDNNYAPKYGSFQLLQKMTNCCWRGSSEKKIWLIHFAQLAPGEEEGEVKTDQKEEVKQKRRKRCTELGDMKFFQHFKTILWIEKFSGQLTISVKST